MVSESVSGKVNAVKRLYEKLAILLICFTGFIHGGSAIGEVAAMLPALSVSALAQLMPGRKLTAVLLAVCAALCGVLPPMICMLPLLLYDALWEGKWQLMLCGLTYFMGNPDASQLALSAAGCAVTVMIYLRVSKLEETVDTLRNLRDEVTEKNMQLKSTNEAIARAQDSEIHIATLKERNRIAREIHDNVGHMLTRSLLQAGALMIINKDEQLKEPLESLKTTLDNAMTSIRQSVHDLHDDSIDLRRRISRKSLYMNKSVESSNGLLLMQSGNLLKNTRLSDNIFNSNIHDKNNINFNAQSVINNEQNNNINNNEENKNDNNLDDKNKQKEKEKENKEDEESEENIIKESKISKLVTESLTKKVIILILILLVFFPLLNDDFWNSDSIITYDFIAQILSLHYAMFQTRGIKNNQIDITKLYDSKFPPVNITINGIIYYLNDNFNNFDFRYRELSTVYSDDAMVRIVYSIRKESKLTALLNLFQTIFVCFALTISSILFENDAENLVLKPLEIMIEIVDKVAKDPIGAKNIEELQEGIKAEMETIKQSSDKEENKLKFNILKNKNINNINIINSNNINNNININININNDNLNNSLNNNLNNNNYININNNNNIVNTSNKKLTLITNKEEDENYEVSVIKSAIIKISALLAIGFGDAGGEIIKKNLSYNQSLNPRLKGKKKNGIFAFCDIRQFNEINIALEEKTILFINQIAEIVHSSVDRFKGSTNKNIGESFLNVWKFYNEIKVKEGKKNEKIIKKDNLLEIDPTNPQVGIIADCSILACLRIILKINKNLDILQYNENEKIKSKIPNFKVNMGFGVHMGYGIEGAVGSTYKIDASYLSPNVNIAARLETATRQFKLNILISGILYNLLTDDMKNICRYVDKVFVKGSEFPLDLYTIDLNLNVTKQRQSKILIMSNKEKRNLYNEKKIQLETLIEEFGSVAPIILEKNSYRELIVQRSEEFNFNWNEGIKFYKSGKWKNAIKFFENCLKIDPNDGPAFVLSDFIKSYNLNAPKNWNGVRTLSSK